MPHKSYKSAEYSDTTPLRPWTVLGVSRSDLMVCRLLRSESEDPMRQAASKYISKHPVREIGKIGMSALLLLPSVKVRGWRGTPEQVEGLRASLAGTLPESAQRRIDKIKPALATVHYAKNDSLLHGKIGGTHFTPLDTEAGAAMDALEDAFIIDVADFPDVRLRMPLSIIRGSMRPPSEDSDTIVACDPVSILYRSQYTDELTVSPVFSPPDTSAV